MKRRRKEEEKGGKLNREVGGIYRIGWEGQTDIKSKVNLDEKAKSIGNSSHGLMEHKDSKKQSQLGMWVISVRAVYHTNLMHVPPKSNTKIKFK